MSWPIAKACSTRFHASRVSGTRSKESVWWIILHDEEALTALSAASWFANPKLPEEGGPGGSAHLCVDDNECYRTLTWQEIPWGSASSFGANTHGFHIEQAGYAKWSAVIWKSHLKTLQRAAYKTALWAKFFSIPLRFVDADGLLAGKRGITTHAEVSKASKKQDPAHSYRYTHTDPGAFWPRWLFMVLVRQYAKQMGYTKVA